MQVERERLFGAEYSGERVSNTWATCPMERDNPGKPGLIPHDSYGLKSVREMVASASAMGWARGALACW
jgi:hypothetical protein